MITSSCKWHPHALSVFRSLEPSLRRAQGRGVHGTGGCLELGLPGSARLTALRGHGGLSAAVPVSSTGRTGEGGFSDSLAGSDGDPALSEIRRPPAEKAGVAWLRVT